MTVSVFRGDYNCSFTIQCTDKSDVQAVGGVRWAIKLDDDSWALIGPNQYAGITIDEPPVKSEALLPKVDKPKPKQDVPEGIDF